MVANERKAQETKDENYKSSERHRQANALVWDRKNKQKIEGLLTMVHGNKAKRIFTGIRPYSKI